MDRAGEKCPFCGSLQIIPVIYGYAPFDLLVRACRGEVALGEMCIEDGQPQWKCSSCGKLISEGAESP